MNSANLSKLLHCVSLLILGCTHPEDPSKSVSVTSDSRTADAPVEQKKESGSVHIVDLEKIPKKSDSFGLSKASITEDTLQLKVEYGGGCEKHTFVLYCHNKLKEVDTLEVFIIHDANNDPCEAIVREDVNFDLKPLKTAYLAANPDLEAGELKITFKEHNRSVTYSF